MYLYFACLNLYFRILVLTINPTNLWHWRLPIQGCLNELAAAGLFYIIFRILWVFIHQIKTRRIILFSFTLLWSLLNYTNYQYASSFNLLLPFSWFLELQNVGVMGGVGELANSLWGQDLFFQLLIPTGITFYLLFKWPELILKTGRNRNITYVLLLSIFFQSSTLYPDVQPRLQSAVHSHLLKLWYYDIGVPTFPPTRETPLPQFSNFFKKIVLEKNEDKELSIPRVVVKKPNIVLILLESFRAYELGAYGSKLKLSPNFDRYAKNGLLFTNIYSSYSLTKVGQWSILCGSHQHNGGAVFTNYQNHGVKCLPDYFAELGYETWWFHGQSATYDDQGYFMKRHQVKHIMDRLSFPQEAKVLGWGLSDRDLMKLSLNSLSKSKKPFFAIIQTQTNHHPFIAPVEFSKNYGVGRSLNKFYSTYHFTDAMLGLFLDQFLETEVGKNSLIVITADHGTGKYLREPERINKIPILSKQQVPLLLLYPEKQNVKGMVNTTLGGQPDILPTLLDILNIKDDFPSFGKSLARNYNYRFAKGLIDGGWIVTKDRFFQYKPKETVRAISDNTLNTNKEDKLWLKLGYEIDDIQDWIIQQTDREAIKSALNNSGWLKK